MFDPNPTDRDAALRRDLGRHRTFATGLLVVMAAVTLASYALPRSYAAESDFIDMSVIDSRLRDIEVQRKQIAADQRASR